MKKRVFFIVLLFCVSGVVNAQTDAYKYAYLYRDLPFSMPEVPMPIIPGRVVNIEEYGGVGDAITKNTEAFRRAIEGLSKAGGGKLHIPKGVWYTGPIELKSNIELNLAQEAILVFSSDKDDYPIVNTYFEGLDTRRCQSPISAYRATNIAITGEGVIDGNGQVWRGVRKSKMTEPQWRSLVASGGVVNEKGDYWYPSEGFRKGSMISDMNVPSGDLSEETWNEIKDFLRPVMVSLRECKNVLLEGVIFQNSPAWNIHPLLCENMIVDGVTILNPWYSQNGDGIDVESCTNVIMVNSTIDAGDDALCIKSGKDEQGRARGVPTSNLIADNITVFHGHGGFVVGSEMSGGVRNISITNCKFIGTDVGLRFKSTRGRGGVVENIHIENISMLNIQREALLFDLFYGNSKSLDVKRVADETTPQFKDIFIRHIFCRGARRAMYFNGLPEMKLQNIRIENSSIHAVAGAELRESDGVTLKNLNIDNEEGASLILHNVEHVKVEGFNGITPERYVLNVRGNDNSDIEIISTRIDETNSLLSRESASQVVFKRK